MPFGGAFGRFDPLSLDGFEPAGSSSPPPRAPDCLSSSAAVRLVPYVDPRELVGHGERVMEAYVRMFEADTRAYEAIEVANVEGKIRLAELGSVQSVAPPSSGGASSPPPSPVRSRGGARVGGFSQAASVKQWRSKVTGRAASATSWRSGPQSSSSGFSTLGGAEPADTAACHSGRCYLQLASEGNRSSLVRRCGKWPTVSRLLALPASELSIPKLSQYVLVRSTGSDWHVSSAHGHPPATATVSDVLGRLVGEFNDLLEVGDSRWAGTLLEVLASRPEPLGTFDLPDLSSRVGGTDGSSVGDDTQWAPSRFGVVRISLGNVRSDPDLLRVRVEELERVFASSRLPSVYGRPDMVEGADRGQVVASGPVGWRDANDLVRYLKSCGYLVSAGGDHLAVSHPGSSLLVPPGLVQGLEPFDAMDPGFCYLRAVRSHYRVAMAARLGPFPTFEALLQAPMVAFYSPMVLSRLSVRGDGVSFHLEQSGSGLSTLDVVLKVLAFGKFEESAPGTLLAEYSRDASAVSYCASGFPLLGSVLGAGVGSPPPYSASDFVVSACGLVSWIARAAGDSVEDFPEDVGRPDDLRVMAEVGRGAMRAEAVAWYYVHGVDRPVVLADVAVARLATSLGGVGFERFVDSTSPEYPGHECMYYAIAGLCCVRGPSSLRKYMQSTSFVLDSDLASSCVALALPFDVPVVSPDVSVDTREVSRRSPADVARYFGFYTTSPVLTSVSLVGSPGELSGLCASGCVVVCCGSQRAYVSSALACDPVVLSEVAGRTFERVVFVAFNLPSQGVPAVRVAPEQVRSLFTRHTDRLGLWCPQGLPAGVAEAFLGVVTQPSLADRVVVVPG